MSYWGFVPQILPLNTGSVDDYAGLAKSWGKITGKPHDRITGIAWKMIMDEKLIEIIHRELSQQDTGSLLAIWTENDRESYTPEAFEAIRRILAARIGAGNIPPQGSLDLDAPQPPARSYARSPDLRRQVGQERMRRQKAEIDARLKRAEAYEDQGEYEKALAEYELVLEKSPRRASVWQIKGQILEDLDRLDEALAAYRQAATLEPEDPEIAHDLEAALLKQAERLGYDNLPPGDEIVSPGQPPALYLDPSSRMRGWPGYRTRPDPTGLGQEPSGLDYVDSTAELGQMEGRFIHNLLTGRLRTENPVYRLVMALSGGLSLVTGGGLLLVPYLPALLLGIALILFGSALMFNFYKNIRNT